MISLTPFLRRSGRFSISPTDDPAANYKTMQPAAQHKTQERGELLRLMLVDAKAGFGQTPSVPAFAAA